MDLMDANGSVDDKIIPDTKWHLDRRVPIVLIAVLGAQLLTTIWWAATMNSRVDTLERAILNIAPRLESIIRMEVKMDAMTSQVAENRQYANQQLEELKKSIDSLKPMPRH